MTTSDARTRIQTKAPDASTDRRKSRRIRVKGLICDRGEVIDLSTKGMRLRVHRRWHEGQLRAITIVDHEYSVPVEARCVWCRQEGMFTHVIGLAFQRTSDNDVERLAAIAARHASSDHAKAA